VTAKGFKLTRHADLPDTFATLSVGDMFESVGSGSVYIKISDSHACKLAEAHYFHPGHESIYMPEFSIAQGRGVRSK